MFRLTKYQILELFIIIILPILVCLIVTWFIYPIDSSTKEFTILVGISVSTAWLITKLENFFDMPPSKLTKEEQFIQLFSFNPKNLKKKKYQYEALIKLLQRGGMLMESYLKVSTKPIQELTVNLYFLEANDKNQRTYQEYKTNLEIYMKHFELVEYFNNEFAKPIPHWSKLKEYVKNWISSDSSFQQEPSHKYTPLRIQS